LELDVLDSDFADSRARAGWPSGLAEGLGRGVSSRKHAWLHYHPSVQEFLPIRVVFEADTPGIHCAEIRTPIVADPA
jgi:hypothetical protein